MYMNLLVAGDPCMNKSKCLVNADVNALDEMTNYATTELLS